LRCAEDAQRQIVSIRSAVDAKENSVTFLSDPSYLSAVGACAAAAVIVTDTEDVETLLPEKNLIICKNAYVGYALCAQEFEDKKQWYAPSAQLVIDPTAHISENVQLGPYVVICRKAIIGARCQIGAHVVIGPDVKIGTDCRIDPGVIIYPGTTIGDRVTIQANAVIGSDGFGNAWDGERFHRIPSFGTVSIGCDVDIGAATTIDRAAFGKTTIADGTKIDNLNQIAHNVEIGANSALAAQCGISGSTKIGERVKIGGQSGFVGHIHIGNDAFIGAKSGVSKSVEASASITGYPARPFMQMRKIEAASARLPDALKEIKRLQKTVEQLKKAIGMQEE